MDKYIEAINNISSYEIWHECTYDDGYSNFDDWIEYPFGDDEDIKVLSELITKHDNLNKGIDELLIKYEEEFKILGQDGFGYDFERYGKWLVTENVIQDLKKLKGE